MPNYLSSGPLEPKWKAVYKARAQKTGVSELLRTFDSQFKVATKGLKYEEKPSMTDKLNFTEAEAVYYKVDGLLRQLQAVKDPKLSKWTDAESKFLTDLKKELLTAANFWSDTRVQKKIQK